MNINIKKPIRLDRASAWRTYSGGSLIEKLYGNDGASDTNFPEDWIMSTVRARNAGREEVVEGLSMIFGSDVSLAELIETYPEEMLGGRHLERFGRSLGVLVKIIDSAERLTVQVHPTRAQAKALFDSEYGKTECWHILGGREIDGERAIESDGVFSGIYVLEGEGRLGDDVLMPGSQYFIPAASEPFTVTGRLKLIRFYGPRA